MHWLNYGKSKHFYNLLYLIGLQYEIILFSDLIASCSLICMKLRNRGYSNVFVKYVFYFTSEVDNIYIS